MSYLVHSARCRPAGLAVVSQTEQEHHWLTHRVASSIARSNRSVWRRDCCHLVEALSRDHVYACAESCKAFSHDLSCFSRQLLPPHEADWCSCVSRGARRVVSSWLPCCRRPAFPSCPWRLGRSSWTSRCFGGRLRLDGIKRGGWWVACASASLWIAASRRPGLLLRSRSGDVGVVVSPLADAWPRRRQHVRGHAARNVTEGRIGRTDEFR